MPPLFSSRYGARHTIILAPDFRAATLRSTRRIISLIRGCLMLFAAAMPYAAAALLFSILLATLDATRRFR